VVCLLYDKIGSYSLPRSYVRELEAAGVQVRAFRSTRFGYPTRFQINFRNHRKVVVVDGREGWVGGLNVGDEYLGHDPSFGPWRDTHLRVEGPAALALQLSFVEDWYWATETIPELPWEPVEAGDEPVLILPSGPEGPGDTTGMLVQLAIHHARARVWIATPYFVPTDAVVEALKLAAYRGLDVRILTGRRSDSRFMDLARYPTLERLLGAGARVFGYREGYFHAKTIVIDRFAAGVSTVNLDHRSFRLNFEITALLLHPDAVSRVARSFERDFERSTEFSVQEVASRSLPARIASRTVQLAAPVL
jgi:cardiolipin synthase A/B